MARALKSVCTLTLLIAPLGLLFGGCTLDRLFETNDPSISRLADGYFYVEVSRDRLNELEGPGRSRLKAEVDAEVRKKRICGDGYSILSEGTGRGYYYMKGQCR